MLLYINKLYVSVLLLLKPQEEAQQHYQALLDSLSIFIVPFSCDWILIEQLACPLFILKLPLFGTPSLSFFQNIFLLSSFCLVFIIYCFCHLLPKPDKWTIYRITRVTIWLTEITANNFFNYRLSKWTTLQREHYHFNRSFIYISIKISLIVSHINNDLIFNSVTFFYYQRLVSSNMGR